jgi:LmbE family N-acetylglucosaminyl deacetylase
MSPSDIGELGTVLGVWAHPDDGTYRAGGVVAAARAAGQRVFVLTATRGELGTSDPESWPPHRMAARRERELEMSLDAVGVTEHAILGHPDGGCRAVPAEVGAAEVAGVIDAVDPDTILTFGPDGYTGHPDHRTMADWVSEAVRWTGSPARVLHATTTEGFLREFADVHSRFDVFFAGMPSVTDPEDLALDLRLNPRLLNRKLAALRAQASQTTPLIEAMGLDRFRRWIATESFAAAVPAQLASRLG